MDSSPILGIPLIKADQSGKLAAIDNMFAALENSAQETVAIDLSAGNVAVSDADFTGNYALKATGNTVPRTLTVPATKRFFLVWNSGTGTLTVTVSGGSSLTIGAGRIKAIQSDGSTPVTIAESDVAPISFTTLSDTAGAYAGAASKRIRANAGETALEYHTAGTEKPPQIDKTTEYTTTTPALPLIGLTGFIKKRAFRKSMAFIDGRGAVREIETALYRKNAQTLIGAGPRVDAAESAVTLTNFALGFDGGAASATVKNVADNGQKNFFSLQKKSKVTSAAGTNQAVYWSSASLPFARGSVSGTGGFFAVFRFALGSRPDDAKVFIGLGADTGSLATTWASNTTGLNACLGIIKEPTDINWNIIQKVSASTSFTKTIVGIPAVDSVMYELRLYCEPGGVPYYSLEQINAGTVVEGQFTNDATLPSTTTLLYPVMRAQTTSTSGTVELQFSRLYFENEIAVI